MRIAVVSPTYNERDNIGWFLESVRAALPTAQIFIVDDNSPDGTGVEADRLAAELGNITVVHRAGKEGLGSAYRHGFNTAIDEGFDVVVSMDVDRSHDPVVLPSMMAAVDGGADIVVGSRYVPGGSTVNWPLHRRVLSSWGNRYTGFVLGLRVRDCTSAYRAYRADVLKAVNPGSTRAEGYAFLTELLRRAQAQGRTVVEVPITFVDREHGTSKMSGRIIAESMLLVTGWGARDFLRKVQRVFGRLLGRGKRSQ
ncbi:MAG: polyprenol monophosphomannose synthase [Actinomycetota bacterium]|nr:polyprenol monophosphomannose synthase [Actinomycetota bacterium]